MATRRTIRVSEIIRKELSAQIVRTRALEGTLVTISSVETTPDLKQAFIYVSVLETGEAHGRIVTELNKHRHIWQRELGRHLKTKFTPSLQFRFDEAIERGDRVMEILHDIEVEEEVKKTKPE